MRRSLAIALTLFLRVFVFSTSARDEVVTPSIVNPPIARTPVESSSLASIGFNKRRHILDVEFRTGAIYRYRKVPVAVFKEFMSAASKGKYFTSVIRPNYAFERLRESTP